MAIQRTGLLDHRIKNALTGLKPLFSQLVSLAAFVHKQFLKDIARTIHRPQRRPLTTPGNMTAAGSPLAIAGQLERSKTRRRPEMLGSNLVHRNGVFKVVARKPQSI